MKTWSTLLFLFLLHIQTFAEARVIISNGTLIDGHNPDRPNMTMIISGDEILSIQPSAEAFDIEPNDHLIDATNKFIIPGLWDAHVHLTFIPDLDHVTSYRLFVSQGITSIRDTGALITKLQPAIDYVEANPGITPRLFFSGPLIDGKDRVYKGEEPGFPNLSIGIDEQDNVEDTVDRLVSDGATFLKSYEMLSQPTYLELLRIAKKKNLRVTGHIPLSIDLTEAVKAGLGGMQHIRNMDLACSNNAESMHEIRQVKLQNKDGIPGSALRTAIHQAQRFPSIANYDQARCEKIIQLLSDYGVYQTPTLTINTYDAKRYFADPNWRKNYNHLPDSVRKRWEQESILAAKEPVSENGLIFQEWSMKLVELFDDNEVKILAGTDTPIGYLTPGFSLHKELELLVEAGLSAKAALRAATLSPAEFFNLESTMGTLDEGKVADILILNQNPIENIQHTQDIFRVIVKGSVANFGS